MISEHSSLRTYFTVYALLIAGLAATVGVAYMHVGGATIAIALMIAFAKAALVVIYFMHVRDSPPLNWIAIAAGLVWLSILLSFVLVDYGSRSWIPIRAPAGIDELSGG
jgi:cytochrome c oxidase subunit IV